MANIGLIIFIIVIVVTILVLVYVNSQQQGTGTGTRTGTSAATRTSTFTTTGTRTSTATGVATSTTTGTQTSTSTTTLAAVLAFTPASGPIGTLITITRTSGTFLTTKQDVIVGGVPAVYLSSTASTLIAFVMPGAVTGTVQVTTSGTTVTSSASFTVTATGAPTAQEATGKHVGSNGVGSFQGQSVALSADGNTLIVGGPGDDGGAGAAWIFRRTNGSWSEFAKLRGTGGVPSGFDSGQGSSVAISADGNTVMIGSFGDNGEVGASWIFHKSESTYVQERGVSNAEKLVGSGSSAGSWQGYSVALSSDGQTAMMGGHWDASGDGAAWVFTKTSPGVWTQQGNKLVRTTRHFGKSVALSANGNTAIIGAYGDSGYKGSAFVFVRSGAGDWSEQSKLIGDGDAVSQQGYSVGVSSDGNTAVFGGDADRASAGSAWVFVRSGTSWTQAAKLIGTGNVGVSLQGSSVDISADGITIVSGGRADTNNVGATWVFKKNTSGVWAQLGNKLVGDEAMLSASGINQGYSVSLSKNGTTLAVGGPSDNPSGATWIFV